MTEKAAAFIRISGRVQGVGYRYFALAQANRLGLYGWVRNTPDGAVECEVEGLKESIDAFIPELQKGPSLARVETIRTEWRSPARQFSEFTIR